MTIIGVDFHPEFQQIAWVDTDTGELQDKRLAHPEEAEQFYRTLAGAGQQVRVGMEARYLNPPESPGDDSSVAVRSTHRYTI